MLFTALFLCLVVVFGVFNLACVLIVGLVLLHFCFALLLLLLFCGLCCCYVAACSLL